MNSALTLNLEDCNYMQYVVALERNHGAGTVFGRVRKVSGRHVGTNYILQRSVNSGVFDLSICQGKARLLRFYNDQPMDRREPQTRSF